MPRLFHRSRSGSESINGLNKAGRFETFSNPIYAGKLWPTVMKEINPDENVNTVHVDLKVTTGPSVRLKLVDPGGKPVIGAMTIGRNGRGTYDGDAMTTAEGEALNLMPDEERSVVVRHAERKLGKVVRVRKGDDAKGPAVVTLKPLAAMTGRVTDADGSPVQNASVRPQVLPFGDFGIRLDEVTTDGKGRFLVPDVPTGCGYALAVESAGPVNNRRFAFTKKDITVMPGETAEVGDIRFEKQ